MRRKVWITVPAVVLLMGLYCLIFFFSSDEGEASSSKSHKVSEACVDLVDQIRGNRWTQAMKQQMADYYEHPIRKLAHFSEYCLMGILLFIIWRQWLPGKKWLWLFLLGWIFLSAGLDEIHQLFVDGRDGNLLDVMLDTTGGAFGLFLSSLSAGIFKRLLRKAEG